MDKPEINGLSQPELELLANYLFHTHDSNIETVVDVLTTQEFGSNDSFGAGLADVLHFLSESISTTDRQVFRLDEMRENLQQMVKSSPPNVDLPKEAEITPKKLHRLAIRSELTTYYSHAGVLIEELSTELILDSIVDEDRRSNRVKNDVENESQYERGWLLFISGVINSGEWDNIRETYKKRNDLVHNSVSGDQIIEEDIESEIHQAWDSVNLLHKKLFGIGMNQRISEKILGNEF